MNIEAIGEQLQRYTLPKEENISCKKDALQLATIIQSSLATWA